MSAYPRALRLQGGDIVLSVMAKQASGHRGATILKSSNDGSTFSTVGHIDDPSLGQGACCATLYELPHALGKSAAGTLLWAAAVKGNTQSDPMWITVWTSQNAGATWSKQSNAYVATVPQSQGGLWEPEFSQLDDGTLICYISDETAPGHSQRLAAVRTTDLVNWTAPAAVVALNDPLARPGMANVRRGPGGTYFMSYELCYIPNKGVVHPENCAAHLRTSADGSNWGDPNDAGWIPKTADGKEFRHAPTLAWSPNPSPNGRFFLVGQMVYPDSSDQTAPEDGKVIFANTQGGQGNWSELAAPVPVPDTSTPADPSCPNYSSSMLPLDDGALLLEVAAHYDGQGNVCTSDFARGSVR